MNEIKLLIYSKRTRIILIILACIVVGVTLCILIFKPSVQPSTQIKKVSTASQISQKAYYTKLADATLKSYEKGQKVSSVPEATADIVRYQAVYDDIYNKQLKKIMSAISIPDTTVKALVSSGNYDKVVKIAQIKMTDLKTKVTKNVTAKVCKSAYTSAVKVGQYFNGGTVMSLRDPTAAEKFDDAKGYLISVKAVQDIDSLTKSYLDMEASR